MQQLVAGPVAVVYCCQGGEINQQQTQVRLIHPRFCNGCTRLQDELFSLDTRQLI